MCGGGKEREEKLGIDCWIVIMWRGEDLGCSKLLERK